MTKNVQNTNYNCGISNEKKVANRLTKEGAQTKLSPGSRGAYDVLAASTLTKKKWAVQVKSTCMKNGKPKNLTQEEFSKLILKAEEKGATAVIAKVDGRGISFTYAKTGRKAAF